MIAKLAGNEPLTTTKELVAFTNKYVQGDLYTAQNQPFKVSSQTGFRKTKSRQDQCYAMLTRTSCAGKSACSWEGVAEYFPSTKMYQLQATGQHDADAAPAIEKHQCIGASDCVEQLQG